MKHLMIDLETWGTEPGDGVRSIGAVTFDPHGEGIGDSFYCNITEESNMKAGLRKDPKTVRWWEDQDPAVQSILSNYPRHLPVALQALSHFYDRRNISYVWSHGKIFDIPILQVAYRACSLEPPWLFRNVRDTRTIFHFFGDPPLEVRGIKHYALDDAEYMVLKIQKALGECTKSPIAGTIVANAGDGSAPGMV